MELGWGLFDRPFHYLEAQRNDWIVHADSGELSDGNLVIEIDVDDPSLPGEVVTQATEIEYGVAEAQPPDTAAILSGGGPNGGILVTGITPGGGPEVQIVVPIVSGPAAILTYALKVVSNGHYVMHKVTGSDRGFYLLPCSAGQQPPTVEPRTIGFWKNHEADLAQHLPLRLGTQDITDDPAGLDLALDILNSARSKNIDDMLAAQLLAAKLNVAAGVPPCVQGSINMADQRLKNAGYTGPGTTTPPEKYLKRVVNQIKNKLDEFNNDGCPPP